MSIALNQLKNARRDIDSKEPLTAVQEIIKTIDFLSGIYIDNSRKIDHTGNIQDG